MGEPLVIGRARDWSEKLRGWAFGALMFFSALFGSFYILTPLSPLLFFAPAMWRRAVDRMVGLWVMLPSGVLRFLYGSQVTLVGDKVEHSEPGLIIMNHRTRLDWLFFWEALYQQDPWLLVSEKISLKGILKYLPGAGWAMQCDNFIFLDRSFEKDQSKMEKMLDYYANIGYNYQLLLFPEGTDKCPKATERSRTHAEKKGVVHYDHIVHPRTTGFVFMVQTMRKAGYIKYLYDVTVGFRDCIVQSEVELVTEGVCPTDIHYQIIKIPIADLPEKDEELVEWLVKRWEDKEAKLAKFYSHSKGTFENTENGAEYPLTESAERIQNLIVGVWTFVTIIWAIGYFFLPMQWVYSIFCCVYFTGVFKIYGGMEWLTIDRFRRYRDSMEKDKLN